MNIHLKLQQLILILIIPALSLQILLQGSLVYYEMRTTIVEGIDNVLLTVSDTLAAFLYGPGHEELLTPQVMQALAPSTRPGYCWGIDKDSGNLVTLNLKTGEATRINFPNLPAIRSLAASSSGERIYALGQDERTLFIIAPHSNQIDTLGTLDTDTRGLLYNAQSDQLYGHNTTFFKINLETLKTEPEFKFTTFIPQAISYHSANNQLIALHPDGNQLAFFDTQGQVTKELALTAPPEQTELAAPLSTLLWQTDEAQLYAASTILAKLDINSGRIDTSDMPEGFYSTEGPFYQEARAPMVRIKEELELTYLYTQMNDNAGGIQYGVDASDMNSDVFSPPGSRDVLSPETAEKLEALIFHGNTYITDVEYWEKWGYLKTCYAPIFNQDGNVAAMTGSDLSADSVDTKTRKAAYWSLFFAINAILIAVLVSWLIAKPMTQPIDAMKANALLLAAGNFEQRLPQQSIKELKELGSHFNQLANVIESEVNQMQKFYQRLSFRSISHYLNKYFYERSIALPAEQTSHLKVINAEASTAASIWGYSEHAEHLCFWSFEPSDNSPEDSHINLQIKVMLEMLLQQEQLDRNELKGQMAVFAHERPTLRYLYIDLHQNIIQGESAETFHIYKQEHSGSIIRIQNLDTHLPTHEQLYFADDGRMLDETMIHTAQTEDFNLLSIHSKPTHA